MENIAACAARPANKNAHRRTSSARTPACRHNEGTPLSTSSLPCNSTALAPQGFRLSSVTYLLRSVLPMAGVTQQRRAASVTSLRSQCRPRWVSYPVLFRLRPGGNPPLRPQPHGFIELFSHEIFQFLVARVFAKYITLRKAPETVAAQHFSAWPFSKMRFGNAILTSRKSWNILCYGHFWSIFAK